MLDEMKKLREAPSAVRDMRVKDADFVIVEYAVPMKLGKGQIVPPEAVKERGVNNQ